MKVVKLTLLLVLIALLIGVFYVSTNLDRLVKQGVEQVGSEVLQTTVKLADVNIDLMQNKATLSGLTVANLPGFTAPNLFNLDSISVDVKASSLLQQVIEVEAIRIDGIAIVAEQKGLTSNVQVLQKSLSSSTAPAAAGKDSSESGAGGEVRIKVGSFSLENSKVSLLTEQWGERELAIPAIQLKAIGGEKGATPDQLAIAITKPLLKELRSSIEKQLKQLAEDKAREKIKAKLGDKEAEAKAKLEEKLGEGGVDQLKSLFNR